MSEQYTYCTECQFSFYKDFYNDLTGRYIGWGLACKEYDSRVSEARKKHKDPNICPAYKRKPKFNLFKPSTW